MPFTSDHPSLTLQTWRSPEIFLQPYTWAKPIRYSWLFLTLRLSAPFAWKAHTALTAPNPSIPPGQESLWDISTQARSPVESFMSPLVGLKLTSFMSLLCQHLLLTLSHGYLPYCQ